MYIARFSNLVGALLQQVFSLEHIGGRDLYKWTKQLGTCTPRTAAALHLAPELEWCWMQMSLSVQATPRAAVKTGVPIRSAGSARAVLQRSRFCSCLLSSQVRHFSDLTLLSFLIDNTSIMIHCVINHHSLNPLLPRQALSCEAEEQSWLAQHFPADGKPALSKAVIGPSTCTPLTHNKVCCTSN